jgi:membrane fusion protein, multidrug efflux system
MSSSSLSAARRAVHGGLGVLLIAVVMGCGGSGPAQKGELPPPIVIVAPPVERVVNNYEFATGRTAPLEDVEIRARVSGYLKAIHFKQGTEVEKGKPLFEIDPEPYKADLARAMASEETAKGDKATAEAEQVRAQKRVATTKPEYEREQDLLNKGVGIVANRDKAKGAYDESVAEEKAAGAKVQVGEAKIAEARASVQSAKLNVGYCSINAPITGIVGDRLVTEGNLVTGGTAGTTLLTTIVAVEKMDVAFDIDENTLQRIEQAVRDGKLKPRAPGEIPVEAGLALHGTGYPIKGFMNFLDNRVDTKTGTIRVKARFDNPKPDVGQRLLAAGVYTRVRIPIGEPVKAMLVPEAAFGSDQGIRYLFLVGPDKKAVRWDATVGTQDGDMRVVASIEIPGKEKPRPLTAGDQVIVSGIQRVRPGMTVDPKPATK